MKKIFSILLAAVIIVLGGFLNYINAQSNSVNAYSGEELYKGILFAQGEVAKKLPSTWDDKTIAISNNKKGLAFTEKVVKNIKKQDPKYFKELEQAIYSGNQLAIEKSLTKGAKYFGDFVEATNAAEATSSRVADDSVGAHAGAGLITVAYGVSAVNTSQFVIIVKTGLWKNSINPVSNFDTETVINEIATSFVK